MTLTANARSWSVLAVSALVLLLWLGTRGLNEPDEGRFAEIGREMALQESWLIPHLNGVPHFQKPPLFYWTMACCIRALGVNEWAVRLPSALAAFGTIACTMLIAGILFGPSARWMSGLILLSSALFLAMGRLATTDMLFTFWITASIAGLVVHARRNRAAGLPVFYLCMGLAFLTKGPLGFLIPVSSAIAWQVSLRRISDTRLRLFWWAGMPLALGIGLSWFLAACRHHPALFDYFFRYELVERIATNAHDRHQPFWFFVPVLMVGFLPWALFLPAVAVRFRNERGMLRKPLTWFFVGWFVVPFVVLSCVNSKLATYVLPLMPPLSLVMARLWTEMCGSVLWRRTARSVAVVVMFLAVAFPFGVLAARARHGGHVEYVIAACAAIALSLSALVAAFRMAGRDRSHTVLSLLAGGFLLLCLAFVSQADLILQSSKASMREIARRILEVRSDPDAPVFAYGRAHGLEFYTGQVIARNKEASDVVLPMDSAQAARIIADSAAFIRSLAGREAYVVISERRFRRNPVFIGWHALLRTGPTVLVSPCDHVPPCSAAIVPSAEHAAFVEHDEL